MDWLGSRSSGDGGGHGGVYVGAAAVSVASALLVILGSREAAV